ncbi:unnamed protein product, partial [Mesorhabditis belari]|uniref:DNA-directed RNA polymerase n=1 Tax=Mesorhabditis belari TaxID=2138241 RepID=A0AAF3EHT8_9BILA
MLLQYEDQAEFDTAYRLNLCAAFEDALKFGSFVETLTRVAGYHQVQLPACELSTNTTSDSENEYDMEHIVESGSEKGMIPLIKLTEGRPFRRRVRSLIRNVTLQTVVGARGAAQYVNVGQLAAIQDFFTGGYLMTHKDTFFPRAEVHRFAAAIIDVSAKQQTRMFIPPPAILKPAELWTGKQLIELIIRLDTDSEINLNLKTKNKS